MNLKSEHSDSCLDNPSTLKKRWVSVECAVIDFFIEKGKKLSMKICFSYL